LYWCSYSSKREHLPLFSKIEASPTPGAVTFIISEFPSHSKTEHQYNIGMMKDKDIKLDMSVRHKETGTELLVDFYHEDDEIWVGTDDHNDDWFFKAEDVEPIKSPNHILSDNIHNAIPKVVREIVEGHLKANEELKCQHSLETLDEIIQDLKQYQDSLPRVADLAIVGAL